MTQASTVIPLVRASEVELLTVTQAFVPLKLSAEPYFPPLAQVAFASVPVFPFPEESTADVPAPASNEYAATRPAPELAATVAFTSLEAPETLPAASSAVTL